MVIKTKVGIPVDFTPEQELVVHPITRALINKHKETFRKLEKGEFETNIDSFDAQAEVIWDCMQLNYPEMTEDVFNSLLNSQNHSVAWLAVNSDFRGVDEAKKALAVLQSGNLTGSPTQLNSLT